MSNLLDCLTTGLRWKASQRASTGKPHTRSLFGNYYRGILMEGNAPQRDSTGKPHKEESLGKHHNGTLL
eukprot:4890834-Pyramimonas_sp.AAC.1